MISIKVLRYQKSKLDTNLKRSKQINQLSTIIEISNELELLQEEKENYEFLGKAPMDIDLVMVVGATILGIQVFLLNRIGIALNMYYYIKQYSSFFGTFGITSFVFLIIILLLIIPLFFLLISGFRDLANGAVLKEVYNLDITKNDFNYIRIK